MQKYVYEGPVLEFERLLVDKWKAETIAPSRVKAISNLKHQFKKNNNRMAGARITLPGTLKMVG